MRDYTKYSFYLSLMVLAGLLGITQIPAFSVGGVKLKRANIISDLYRFDDEAAEGGEAELTRDDLDFIREMLDAANYATEGEGDTQQNIEEDGTQTVDIPASQTWDLGGSATGTAVTQGEAPAIELDNTTVIEDFSPDGSIHRFGSLLGSETQSRNVRVAFLGDSFIEGDIITADVREQLQSSYGGQGVGFISLTSITAQYRPTVKHTFKGWKDYLLANKKNVPEEFRERFYISGIISAANSDAWAEYETANYRKHISEVPTVRFFYSSDSGTDITVKINDAHENTFPADSSGQVRQINIAGGGITKFRVSVPASEGFAGYGISMEGNAGVLVDNYSIRSSTGLSLFGTSSSVNSALNRMLGYDLIVLQYGLNIMSAEITGYKNYGEQFRNLIRYIQRCFPSAAIIVMGVGDRSMQQDGDFVTMPAVPAMVAEQRAAAEECGVAFWNTYQAMGGYNSMKRYAEWGWAAKDYTHLSFGGGRKIATEFVKAIEYAKLYPYRIEGAEDIEDEVEDNIPAAVPAPIAPTPSAEAGPTRDSSEESTDWFFGETGENRATEPVTDPEPDVSIQEEIPPVAEEPEAVNHDIPADTDEDIVTGDDMEEPSAVDETRRRRRRDKN